MHPKTFYAFRDLIYEQSGIALSDGKEALVTARIAKRLRALGLQNHEMYLSHLKRDTTGTEIVRLLDAICTNVTGFFREPAHFTFLHHTIRSLRLAGKKRLRIWCAASSTGEEPYTLAMTVLEALEGHPFDVKILATDLSTRVLQSAQEGWYEERKLEGMTSYLRERYFDFNSVGGKDGYSVKPVLREMILFRRLNLTHTPFPMQGPFDAVFCRNVMIYFDQPVRTRLLKDLHRLIRTGGHLMVGHSESLAGIATNFRSIQPAVYVKP